MCGFLRFKISEKMGKYEEIYQSHIKCFNIYLI